MIYTNRRDDTYSCKINIKANTQNQQKKIINMKFNTTYDEANDNQLNNYFDNR